MNLTINQIVDFRLFFDKVKRQEISFKTCYKLTMLAKEIEKQYEFYTEQFSSIVNTYGQKDENGEFITTENGEGIRLQEALINECYSKIDELNSLSVSLPDFTFSIEEFSNLELTPLEVNAIIPFIKE